MPRAKHTCHAHGCTVEVPPKMFMCKPHWFALPKKLQRAIWREYRPGQERDKMPSARYMAVQQLAVAHSAFRANDEQAAAEALVYMERALRFQRLAIERGDGDPLEGLLPEGVES